MSTENLNILLVEDDPFARAMLEQILFDKGYRVKMAKNGLEGDKNNFMKIMILTSSSRI